MRLQSSLLSCALIVGGAGCSPNIHSAAIRGTGYVRIGEVVQAPSALRPAIAARRRNRRDQLAVGCAAGSTRRRANRRPNCRSQSRAASRANTSERDLGAETARLCRPRVAGRQRGVGCSRGSRLGRAGRAADERRFTAAGVPSGASRQRRSDGVSAERHRAKQRGQLLDRASASIAGGCRNIARRPSSFSRTKRTCRSG